jgi:hypothetical protein
VCGTGRLTITKILKDGKRHVTALAFSYARYGSPHQLYNAEDPSTWFGGGRASRGEELTNKHLDQEWVEHKKAKVCFLKKARGRAAQKRVRVQTKTEMRS